MAGSLTKVVGADKVAKAIAAKASAIGPSKTVIVGYTQEYSIFVHENLQAVHPIGQAKYLEQPYREMVEELRAGILADLQAGKKLDIALLRAGLKLQAASQKLCPIDTGALRASAFTRLEQGQGAETA